MTKTQYLLTKLAEECSEASQAALKCVQFGIDDVWKSATNIERLMFELNDIIGALFTLRDECDANIGPFPNMAAVDAKKIKILKWMEHSKEKGVLGGATTELMQSQVRIEILRSQLKETSDRYRWRMGHLLRAWGEIEKLKYVQVVVTQCPSCREKNGNV